MRKSIPMLACLPLLPCLLLFGSCGGDSGTDPGDGNEPTYEQIVAEEVDAAGGVSPWRIEVEGKGFSHAARLPDRDRMVALMGLLTGYPTA